MSCYHPVTAYRSRAVGPDGKRGITFNIQDGYPDLTIQLRCGRCVGCRMAYVQEWTVRLMHENQLHETSQFVTLTYSPEHLPEHSTLVKRDMQLFMKRLRKARSGRIRFFACGEYGENFSRPHYHAILFNADFPDKRKHSEKDGRVLWTSDELNALWGKGFCTFGSVSDESCRYVAGYVMKKMTGEKAKNHYQRFDPTTGEIVDLQPEFILMSRRPGIGGDWYDQFKTDIYPSDFAVRKGKQVPVPKYYDRRLKADDQPLLEAIQDKRLARMRSRKKDNTPERLAVKETVAKAKQSLRPRSGPG